MSETQVDADEFGKSFGALRRKVKSLGEQALARITSDEDKALAAEFRTAVFAHLNQLKQFCEKPSSYFTPQRVAKAAKKVKVDGVSADQAAEVISQFLGFGMRGMQGTVLANNPRISGDWNVLGLMEDAWSGGIYARLVSSTSGEVAVHTADVAYFNDQYLVPSVGSDWFWEQDITVSVRLPVKMPFERAQVDVANDRSLTEKALRNSMETLVKDFSEALAAVENAKEDQKADELEKLRLQVVLSTNTVQPFNRLLTGEGSDAISRSFETDLVQATQAALAWAKHWLSEDEVVQAFTRSVIRLNGKRIRVPETFHGISGHLRSAYTPEEISRGLIAYLDEQEQEPLKLQGAVDDVLRIRGDLSESVVGLSAADAAAALKSLLSAG